ncbi:HTH_48 domain-containing protein [Trichonephila clavipes]|nr:HTH_48 domain-containing protein [Trichonephila clavipes]
MFKVIESPAKCEIRSVILFLTARNMSAADIHHQITEVYGTEAMSDSKVRKWISRFKDGRTNIHEEERSDRLSVIADDGFRLRAIQPRHCSERFPTFLVSQTQSWLGAFQ